MPCTTCSGEIEAGAVVCIHCGAAVVPPPPAFPPPVVSSESVLFASSLLDSDKQLEGIGGWLILVGISLVGTPFIMLGTIAIANFPLLTNPGYQPYLERHPALHGLIVFEVASNLCFVAVLAAMNYLFFKKKRAFPTFMILYLVFHLVVLMGDIAAAKAIMPDAKLSAHTIGSIGRSLLSAAIWIPYFVVSRRVKVTFVS